jgi:hypothetical protein
MIQRIVFIAAAVLMAVAHAMAWADDDPCARNHYILWSGPDHSRAQCIPVVDDDGVAPLAKGMATAVEYFDVAYEHYFTTANATEVAAIDAGLFPGWRRTGMRYRVQTSASADAMPICRVYVPGTGGQRRFHFYSRSPAECTAILSSYNGYDEGVAFYAAVPDANGQCAEDTAPVWRLASTREPAFVYTPDAGRRDTLVANGYVVSGTEYCVPSSASRSAEMTALLHLHTWTIDHVPFQPSPATMIFIPQEAYRQAEQVPDDYLDMQSRLDLPRLANSVMPISSIEIPIGNVGWDPLMDEYVGYSLIMSDDAPGYYGFVMWTFSASDDISGRACTSLVDRNADPRYDGSSHPFQNVLVDPCMPSSLHISGPSGLP